MYNPRERVDLVYAPFTVGFFAASIKRGVNYPVTFQIFDYFGNVFANSQVTLQTSVQHVPPEYYSQYLTYGDNYFVNIMEGPTLTTDSQGKVILK